MTECSTVSELQPFLGLGSLLCCYVTFCSTPHSKQPLQQKLSMYVRDTTSTLLKYDQL